MHLKRASLFRPALIVPLLLVLIQGSLAQQATQQTSPANGVAFKIESRLMGRAMPYRVVLPSAYAGEKDTRFPVIYLLHGLTGHFDNWTDKTKLIEYAARHNYIIVTPEGNDGWYTDSPSIRADKYESYIVKELVPEIDKKFRTVAARGHRAIAGLSMGGYGSIKFGLKYPEMFSLVGSFSGALGAASFNEKNAGRIGKSVDAVYGSTDSESRKANDIFGLVRGLTPEKITALPFIYLDCGTEDFFFQNNRDFVGLLIEKKVPHEYRELPGKHDWVFWDSQVREFLQVADRRLEK